MIFVQYSIVLTFCIAFISASKPYFQHSYYSPNELTDGSVEIDWAAKFNDPDFKDAIHYRLGNPVRKVMGKPETKRNDQTKPETNINNKTQETIKPEKPVKLVKQVKEKQSIVDSMAGSSELSHVVDNMNMNNRHSYPFHHIHNNAKEEILVHRPSPIIVKRPPTKVLINHPPLVVKPAPVIFHRPPAIIMRPIYVNSKPQPVKVQPVYVKVVKKNEKDGHHKQTAKDSMYDDLENDCIHKKPGVYSNY